MTPIAASEKQSAGAVAVRRAISVVGLPASPLVAHNSARICTRDPTDKAWHRREKI